MQLRTERGFTEIEFGLLVTSGFAIVGIGFGEGRDDGAAATGCGCVLGRSWGRSWGRCCELQQLWVDRAHRGRRIGSDLMQRFETAATLRGCDLVYLDTFSFQAPTFYAKRGYRVVLETRGYSGGIVKFTMHKALAGG